MKILFISSTGQNFNYAIDQSVLYRCLNHIENLNGDGYFSKFVTQNDFEKNEIDSFDTYIFHRPRYSSELSKRLDTLKKKSKSIIADYDDVVFGEGNFESSFLGKRSINNLSSEAKERALKEFNEYQEAVNLFSFFTVSTPILERELAKIANKAVIQIIRNGFSYEVVKYIEKYVINYELLKKNGFQINAIGYFAGSVSHINDWKIIEHTILELLEKHKDAYFFLVAQFNSSIKELANHERFVRIDRCEYLKMFHHCSKCHTLVAPLENNVGNNAKSIIKLYDSSLTYNRLVSSPIDDYDIVGDNAKVHYVKKKEDWFNTLDLCYSQMPSITELSQNKDYVINNCLSSKSTDDLIRYLKTIK